MENRYNKYKNIIERAILAGIISEDSRQSYFSDIQEAKGSEISRAESLLSIEKSENSYSHYQPENELINKIAFNTPRKNTCKNKLPEIALSNCCDNHSMISVITVDNDSFLDIKTPEIENSVSSDSQSEAFSLGPENIKPEKCQNMKSIKILSECVKKPAEYQILDFNVPIYFDVKKKKSPLKSCAFNSDSSMKNFKTSKVHCCKLDSIKLSTNGKVHDSSKFEFPKIVDTKKQDILSKNTKNFVPNSSSVHCINENPGDQTGPRSHCKSKSVQKNAHSFSSGMTDFGNHKEKSRLIKKCCHTEPNRTAHKYHHQVHNVNTCRRLKVNSNFTTTKQKHKPNENHSTGFETGETLAGNKNEKETQIYVPIKSKICKHSEFWYYCNADNPRISNNIMTTETDNEDGISQESISMGNVSDKNEHCKLLNVNIICHIFDDDERVSNKSNIQRANNTSHSPLKKAKSSKETASENEKIKKNNKRQVLSNFFTKLKSK